MKIEFYMDHSGTFEKVIYFKMDAAIDWRRLDSLTEIEIEAVFGHLLKFPKARTALLLLSHTLTGKRSILKQFILCNWTRIDNKLDISEKTLQFESVYCPMKHTGNCPYKGAGIICQKL